MQVFYEMHRSPGDTLPLFVPGQVEAEHFAGSQPAPQPPQPGAVESPAGSVNHSTEYLARMVLAGSLGRLPHRVTIVETEEFIGRMRPQVELDESSRRFILLEHIGKTPIEKRASETACALVLPADCAAGFTIEHPENGPAMATHWGFAVGEDLRGYGVERRLIRASVHEMVARGIDIAQAVIDNVDEFHLLRSVLHDTMRYSDADGRPISAGEALRRLQSGEAPNINGVVDIKQLKRTYLEYETVEGEEVIDGADILYTEPKDYHWEMDSRRGMLFTAVNNSGAGLVDGLGEAHWLWQRFRHLDPMVTDFVQRAWGDSLELVAREVAANRENYTFPVDPEQPYYFRLSLLPDPDDASKKVLCLRTFFYGEIRSPGLSKTMNDFSSAAALQKLHVRGRSRDPEARAADAAGKADGVLQDTGRGVSLFAGLTLAWCHNNFFEEVQADGTVRIQGGGFTFILARDGDETLLEKSLAVSADESDAAEPEESAEPTVEDLLSQYGGDDDFGEDASAD